MNKGKHRKQILLIEDSESMDILLSSYFIDVDGDNLIYSIELNTNEIIETKVKSSIYED